MSGSGREESRWATPNFGETAEGGTSVGLLGKHGTVGPRVWKLVPPWRINGKPVVLYYRWPEYGPYSVVLGTQGARVRNPGAHRNGGEQEQREEHRYSSKERYKRQYPCGFRVTFTRGVDRATWGVWGPRRGISLRVGEIRIHLNNIRDVFGPCPLSRRTLVTPFEHFDTLCPDTSPMPHSLSNFDDVSMLLPLSELMP